MESAKRIRARKYIDEKGKALRNIRAIIFVYYFAEKFDVIDPEEVIVDFRESKISDMSAIDAVHKLTERYAKAGKNSI
jgi:SulP family sulfate permease